MQAKNFETYAAFWPHYLRQHADPRTRAIHAGGTAVGLALFLIGLVFGPWWLVLLALAVGYGAAWASHLLIEGNRPATFGHPLWSLGSDLRMAWLLVTGRLDGELRRAGVARGHRGGRVS